MSFDVPDDFDAWCVEHERFLQAQLDASADRPSDDPRARVIREASWAAGAVLRQAHAEQVIEWLKFLDRSGAAARLIAAGVEDLELWGPFTEDAQPTTHHSGARWYLLDPVTPAALVQIHRRGPAWGDTRTLRDIETFVATVPSAICRRMAEDVADGTVWSLVRQALLARTGIAS